MEFELTDKTTEDGLIIWNVKSKGLTIGTLALDEKTKGYDYSKCTSIQMK